MCRATEQPFIVGHGGIVGGRKVERAVRIARRKAERAKRSAKRAKEAKEQEERWRLLQKTGTRNGNETIVPNALLHSTMLSLLSFGRFAFSPCCFWFLHGPVDPIYTLCNGLSLQGLSCGAGPADPTFSRFCSGPCGIGKRLSLTGYFNSCSHRRCLDLCCRN